MCSNTGNWIAYVFAPAQHWMVCGRTLSHTLVHDVFWMVGLGVFLFVFFFHRAAHEHKNVQFMERATRVHNIQRHCKNEMLHSKYICNTSNGTSVLSEGMGSLYAIVPTRFFISAQNIYFPTSSSTIRYCEYYYICRWNVEIMWDNDNAM